MELERIEGSEPNHATSPEELHSQEQVRFLDLNLIVHLELGLVPFSKCEPCFFF